MVLAADGKHLPFYLGSVLHLAKVGGGVAALRRPEAADDAFLVLLELRQAEGVPSST